MPGPSLNLEAFVLLHQPPSDAFQTLTLFSAENGALRVIQRVPKKAAVNQPPLDLFDEVSVLLEGAPSGDAWFLKEARILHRHEGIGRRYESLVQASAFARVVARNPGAEESHPAVHALLRTAFAAFASSDRPDIVYLKSLYCFARDEGHPVKQHWFPALTADDRSLAVALINQPLAGQSTPARDVERLTARLKDYLGTHADMHID